MMRCRNKEDGKQSLTGVVVETTQKEIENNQLESREGVTLTVNILTSAPPVLARFALKKGPTWTAAASARTWAQCIMRRLWGCLPGETGKQLDLPTACGRKKRIMTG